MDIGKGAVSQVSYLKQPQIGSPDVEGDLQNANLLPSGSRSITIEDIEELTGIKTKEQKSNATKTFRQVYDGNLNWYNNHFRDYFETTIRPDNNVRIPVLNSDSGYKLGKPLYTAFNMYKDDENISENLKEIIFKTDRYRLASRCVFSNENTSYFSVRDISSIYLLIINQCYGTTDNISPYSSTVYIRPVVQLQTGININISTQDGYNWEVDQT